MQVQTYFAHRTDERVAECIFRAAFDVVDPPTLGAFDNFASVVTFETIPVVVFFTLKKKNE